MPWQLHPAKSTFPQFAADWDRLNTELYGGHPYFDSRFVGALLEHFGNGSEQLCLYVEKGIVNAAIILEPRRWGRWASFRPSQAQVTAILISDARLLKTLFGSMPGFVWSIELNAIDPRFSPNLTSPDFDAIAFGQAYTIGVAAGLRFDHYWNTRSKNLKANIRRYLNRLEREFAQFTLTRTCEFDAMKEGVARFGALESAGWKGAAGTAISADNAQGSFYTDVLQRFATTGQAAIYRLDVDGQTIASRLIIDSPSMSVILKTTYDEAFARIAPGRIQLHRLIEDQLTHRPQQTIEFYTNATRDQKEWATFGQTILNVQLFRTEGFVTAFSILKSLRNALGTGSQPINPPDGQTTQTFPDIPALRQSAINVNNLSLGAQTEAQLEWFELLQQTVFAQDPGVLYHGMDDGKQVLALLPVRHSGRLVRNIEALANYYTPLYAPLKSEESDTESLKHLLAHAASINGIATEIRLAPMDSDSLVFHELYGHLLTIGWTPFRFFCFGNWYLKVDSDWNGYLKQRSGNLRSRIKRKTKRFIEEGGVLEIVTESNQAERAVSAFHEVYSSSWKRPEPYPDFIPALVRYLVACGTMRMGIAWLNEKPIAAQLWIVTNDKASIYKVAYDEGLARYSPGTVLTAYLLQHVIDLDKVKEVDFLIGDDEYKKEWMSHRRERWGIVAYNPRTFFGLAKIVVETVANIGRPIRKWLMDTEFQKSKCSTSRNRH